jgi:hypothetical protein
MGFIPRPAGMKPNISGYLACSLIIVSILIFHNSNDMLSNHKQVKNQYTLMRKNLHLEIHPLQAYVQRFHVENFLLRTVLAFVATHYSIQQ